MRKLNKNCKIEIFKYLSKGDITSYLCALYQGTPKESRGEIIEMFLFLFDNILDVETIEKDKKLESIHIIKPQKKLVYNYYTNFRESYWYNDTYNTENLTGPYKMDPQAWELKTKILTEVIDAMFGDHPFTPRSLSLLVIMLAQKNDETVIRFKITTIICLLPEIIILLKLTQTQSNISLTSHLNLK